MNSESFDFVKNYPARGDLSDLTPCDAFYDVCYTGFYREMIEEYHKGGENRISLQQHVLDKIKHEILVDLGCGSWGCNVAALAYLANAKAYVGIDVNADLYDSNDDVQMFLREQYNLPDSIASHTTLIKNVKDMFEDFLRKAPDKAGYNFAMNGLILNKSTHTIKKHLQRIMVPGNVILANKVENIDMSNILVGPHHDTIIYDFFDWDAIHVYQKLDEHDATTPRRLDVYLKHF